MKLKLKNLKIVDVTESHQIKRELGSLSHELEYKLKNPNSERKLITTKETYKRLRSIIDLVEKI